MVGLLAVLNEPEINITCDSCKRNLTHTVRIKCADPVCCQTDEPVDICPGCFCAGKEFGKHKRWHAYRVIVRVCYPKPNRVSSRRLRK